jgi:hypothetical protein
VTLDQFIKDVDLFGQTELEKVRLMAYYMQETTGSPDFTAAEASDWLVKLSLPEPNRSRLRSRLAKSRAFVRGGTKDSFRLHGREFERLRAQLPNVGEPSEEVISADTILPSILYENTRGFIESLGKQINASFEHNIFDGCAVLMRRLVEILLILAYQRLSIDGEITNASGDYVMLDSIITNARANKTLALSRNSKANVDEFRTLGNFSAHKIFYNARRGDVRKHIVEFRALVEELLYKSGIRT